MKLLIKIAVISMLLLLLCGCSDTESNNTVKILMPGEEPQGFSEVCREIQKRLAEDKIDIEPEFEFRDDEDFKDYEYVKLLAGESYDIVYDSTNGNFKDFANIEVYADISDSILNDEKYSAIKNQFPDTVWEILKKRYYGKICGIPRFSDYGNENILYYRTDVSDTIIDDYEDVKEYFVSCLDRDKMKPLAVKRKTGLSVIAGENLSELAQENIVKYRDYYILLNDDNKSVKDIVYAYEPSDAFDGDWGEHRMGAGLNIGNGDIYAEWNIFIDDDNGNNPKQEFLDGKVCAYVGTENDYTDICDKLNENFGIYALNAAKPLTMLEMTDFICVCEKSKNKDKSLELLNWIADNTDIQDLLHLGIEGRDYEYVGADVYKEFGNYSFNEKMLTKNPQHILFENGTADWVKQLVKRDLSEYEISPIAGFVLYESEISDELKLISENDVSDDEKYDFYNGRGSDFEGKVQKSYEEIKEPLKTVKAELKRQIDLFLQTGENSKE